MIFYFTGTGNALYAAKYISANIHDDKLINMADAVRNGEFFYYLHDGEAAGFVFPVYYGGMPSVVNDFIKKLRLTSEEDPYVYAVLVHGGMPCAAMKSLRDALDKRDTDISAAFQVKMPDNYVVMYDPCDEPTAQKTLRAAEETLLTAATTVLERTHEGVSSGTPEAVQTASLQIAYRFMRKTASFHADDTCVGCGLCEKICPVGAIELREGKPVWIKKECSHCVACISRCPVRAIQYGEKTRKRGRYVHPIFKDKLE